MIEILLLVGLVGAVGAGITALLKHNADERVVYHIEGEPRRLALTAKAEAKKSPEEKHAAIPLEIRQELDEDPQWWERQYHRALEAVGAEKILDGDWEPEEYTITSANGNALVHVVSDHPYELEGCICSRCEEVRGRQVRHGEREQRWLRSNDVFETLKNFHKQGRGY